MKSETDSDRSHASPRVRIQTASGEWIYGDMCVVTVPLGVLQNRNKKEALSFSIAPKSQDLINQENGCWNHEQSCARFPYVFWDANADFFGQVVDSQGKRVYKTPSKFHADAQLSARASSMINSQDSVICFLCISNDSKRGTEQYEYIFDFSQKWYNQQQ